MGWSAAFQSCQAQLSSELLLILHLRVVGWKLQAAELEKNIVWRPSFDPGFSLKPMFPINNQSSFVQVCPQAKPS